ncbi:MAG: hypothetical protein JW732_02325 [Dehalococcoidia bacterium]|nr:hypothetical protein [Dehalococcoidia bacterium]
MGKTTMEHGQTISPYGDSSVDFHFYGLGLRLQSSDTAVVESIRREFSYFETGSGVPQMKIEVFDMKPPYDPLPDLPASIYTPRNVCYQGKEGTFIDYSGQALEIFNHKTKNCRIFSQNPDLRREIGYLSILSIVSQYLDSRHIHRVHALGISRNGKAVLILSPKGGGKSTLALQLLESGQVKLLSEDSPLISRGGDILPFPLAIGVRPGTGLNISAEYLQEVNQWDSDRKLLVDIKYFADRISPPCKPRIILLGRRNLGPESKIEPASKLAATKAFIRDSVVGLGLFEGAEYVLQRSAWEVLGKTGVVLSRLNNSLRVIARSRVYTYTIGRDRNRNRDVLLDFLKQLNL